MFKLSIIESLAFKIEDESRRNPSAILYLNILSKNLSKCLIRQCFKILNEGVFENKLPSNIALIWKS